MRFAYLVVMLIGAAVPIGLAAADATPAPPTPTHMGPPAPPVDPAARAAALEVLKAIAADKLYPVGLLADFDSSISDVRENFRDQELKEFDIAIIEAKALLMKNAAWSAEEAAQRLVLHFSTEELKQMTAFFVSSAGRKTLQLMPQLIGSELTEYQRTIIKNMPEIKALVETRMRAAQQADVLSNLPPGIAIGKPFPEIAGSAIDGRTVSLQALKGKVVLIDFWATWCGPCMNAMPEILEDYKGLHAQGLEIIGISLDEEQSKLEAVVKDRGIPWPQLYDGKSWDSPLATRFRIHSIPASFLINRDGTLAAVDATGDVLVDAIRKAQAAK